MQKTALIIEKMSMTELQAFRTELVYQKSIRFAYMDNEGNELTIDDMLAAINTSIDNLIKATFGI